MLKMKKFLSALAAVGLVGAANANILTTPDGPINFGGFDWASNGSILIDSYNILAGMSIGTTDTFTLTYQAYADAVQNAAGQAQTTPGLRRGSGSGYEYTINAVINETVTCITVGCTVVSITPTSGNWTVYYQAVGNANVVAGTGILDGLVLMAGNFTSGDTIIAAQGTSNPGNVALGGSFSGAITNPDPNGLINPDFTSTTAITTLQFGTRTTAWTRPTAFDGVGPTGPDTNVRFVGQADANQSFVPEPGSLALAGLALVGLAAVGARRKQA